MPGCHEIYIILFKISTSFSPINDDIQGEDYRSVFPWTEEQEDNFEVPFEASSHNIDVVVMKYGSKGKVFDMNDFETKSWARKRNNRREGLLVRKLYRRGN